LLFDAIPAKDHYTMFPGLQEVIIKEYFPLAMKEFTEAMSHESQVCSLPSCCLCSSKILEGGRKLIIVGVVSPRKLKQRGVSSLSESMQCVHISDVMVYTGDILIRS
jgi:hypothetical protein